jgi:MFS family permease
VTKTGFIFIPMAIGLMIASQIGAKLSTKFESRFVIAAGMFIAAFAMFSMTNIDIKWGALDIIYHLFILAFGLGMGLAPLTNASTSSIPIQEVGIASSVLALARNISGAFGVAIFATILTNSTTSRFLDIQRYSIINTKNPQLISAIFGLMSVKASILSFSTVFFVSSIIMIIGAISALFVIETKVEGKKRISTMVEI